jgi:hypothetical protein
VHEDSVLPKKNKHIIFISSFFVTGAAFLCGGASGTPNLATQSQAHEKSVCDYVAKAGMTQSQNQEITPTGG